MSGLEFGVGAQDPTLDNNEGIDFGDRQTDFACPRCDETLVDAVVDGQVALACPGCRGLIMKHATFATIVRQRRAAFRGAAFTPTPLDLEQLSDPVYCPGCGRTMEVHPYYGPGNQIIDSCCRCGLVWIDAGELTAIERAPGLRQR